MSCRWTALFFLFLPNLRVQSIDLTHARFVPSSLEYELPEVDGSAVDICRIFLDPTPSPVTTTTTPTTTTTTRKRVVTTTKKPAVQSPPNKTKTKNSGAPIRPKLPPSRPITVSHYNPAASLYRLWANHRGHTAASLRWLNGIISQSVRKLPRTNYGVRSSDSDESGAAVLKRAGRMNGNRWKIGSFSSEDSSDES